MINQENVIAKVYKIINTTNNRVYIGRTTKNIETRFKAHKRNKSNNQLSKDLKNKKYSFKCEEICWCFDGEDINKIERHTINNYGKYYNMYNLKLPAIEEIIVDSDDKGFTCECGVRENYPAYVFAHWDNDLIFTCGCKRKYSVLRGIVVWLKELRRRGK